MKLYLCIAILIICFTGCADQKMEGDLIVGSGQMPNLVKDNNNNLHMVYGKGDSLMYTYSDNNGKSFEQPVIIDTISDLVDYATRGPQITATKNGIVVIAVNRLGNIFSLVKNKSGKWIKTASVNDVDTTDKEGFLGLSSDGGYNLFAIWLDLRVDGRQKIYGARSTDGGKTWSKNIFIYASPDSTVCECCKPSVAMKGNNVYVMFRNWLNGNRDLYLIHSSDGGNTFGGAQKLGTGSWALDGCPMDGGGIAIDQNGNPQTVWNRKGMIYACEPEHEEKKLGEGRACTIESVNGKNIYAWVEKGDVIIRTPEGIQKNLGRGQLPLIKAINNQKVLCVWENDKKIHRAILEI